MKKKPTKSAARPSRKPSAPSPRPERDRSPRKSPSGLSFDSYPLKGHVFDYLEVTEVRLALLNDRDSNAKALCSITFNDAFSVGGLRVIDGSKGLFVSMPQRQGGDGEYHDTAFPLTKDGRETIGEAVLDAYSRAGGK